MCRLTHCGRDASAACRAAAIATRCLAQIRVVHAGGGKKSSTSADFVAVPLLPVHAGTPDEAGDKVVDLEQVQAESILAAPIAWCLAPESEVRDLPASDGQFDVAVDPGWLRHWS